MTEFKFAEIVMAPGEVEPAGWNAHGRVGAGKVHSAPLQVIASTAGPRVGACGHKVWLGSETVKKVAAGEWAPVCHECATAAFPGRAEPIKNAGDHQRTDGPHA